MTSAPAVLQLPQFTHAAARVSPSYLYYLAFYEAAGDADEAPVAQLYNPAESTVWLIVHRAIAMSGAGATSAYVGISSVEIDPLSANIAAVTTVFNNRGKAYAGSAEWAGGRHTDIAALLPAADRMFRVGLPVLGTAPFDALEAHRPLIVEPGFGLTIAGSAVNTSLNATVEWTEASAGGS